MKMEQVYGELELAKSEIEKLKFTVNEKESRIKHLISANAKLKTDSDETIRKLEEENCRFLKAVDEADEKNKGHDRMNVALRLEVENIKSMLSASQKKCLEAETEVKALKETRKKEDELVRLEDGKRKVEDQLKWKKEQFELLKQAHERLKDQFEESKREWKFEKSSLLDEVSTLQSTVDSQKSKAESLRSQLEMCKQALAHEENRRQNLESRVSEMKSRLESVSDECWEAKSRVYCSNVEINDEISDLRDELREKESELKEVAYKAKKLEKENQDLLNSLKELQEAHIPKALSTPPSAMAKIKSKLKSMEQTHKECLSNSKSKEAEWSSRVEKMKRDLEEQKFFLNLKEASIKDLKKDNTDLKLQNEELSLMLQLLRTEFAETRPNCEQNSENEIKKYKKMLDESYKEQVRLKQELEEVSDALERSNCELNEKLYQGSEFEFELQIWMLAVERLRIQLEENQWLRRQLEASLLAQAEFEEELKLEIKSLKQQFGLQECEEDEENVNQQFYNTGKAREVRASDERLPFRELN